MQGRRDGQVDTLTDRTLADFRVPQIPNFDLICRIGSGAFGHVYLARERLTGVLRAVKFLKSDSGDRSVRDIDGVRRYQRIANQHPHLVQILTVGESEGVLYYIMECADAQNSSETSGYEPTTLRSLKRTSPLMDARQALVLVGKLASGAVRLSEQGLAHNDLKPENVLIIQGEPKIADVGLAAPTSTTQLVGTPAYMTPDGRSDDCYALGRILYELVSGKPASDFPSLPKELLAADDPMSSPAVRIANRACHTDLARRFHSPAVLHEEIQKVLRQSKNTNQTRVATAILASITLVALFLLWTRSTDEPIPRKWDIDVHNQSPHDGYTRIAVENVEISPFRTLPGNPVEVNFDITLEASPGHLIFVGVADKNQYLATAYQGTPGQSGFTSRVKAEFPAPGFPGTHALSVVVAHVSTEVEMRESVKNLDAEATWIGTLLIDFPSSK